MSINWSRSLGVDILFAVGVVEWWYLDFGS
jgi:hypothetical protein